MILPASYSNGFAPRDGAPLYPELWRGCVGAWAPCLGPSGLVLRDHSGYGNHGTLTNGPTFQTSQGRYAIDFDATNDHIPALGSRDLSLPISVCAWFCPVTGFNQLCGQGDGYTTGTYLSVNTATGAYWVPTFLSPVGTITAGKWTHICGTYDGATARLYLNGIQVASSGTWGRTDSASQFEIGRVKYNTVLYYDGNGKKIDDVRRYSRAISPNEVRLLASRRGIAYELAPRRRSSVLVPANITRYNLFTGSSAIQIIGGAS